LRQKSWKGVRRGGRLFILQKITESELLHVPDFSAAEAAASLPVNFLVIVSWSALLSMKKSISKGLAAPRAKETIYRENHQDRSHFLHVLVRTGSIRTISRRRPSDAIYATATWNAAFSTFNPAITGATWTRPKRAARPAAGSRNTAAKRTNGRASQH
jgi:hypothetical protein